MSRAPFHRFHIGISLLLLGVASVHGATYYVAPNGSDSNNGLTRATAWGTMQYAGIHMGGGNTLMVAGGVYDNTAGAGKSFIPVQSGPTVNRPTIIQAITGETPIFTGASTYNIFLQAGNNVIIDGLHYQNTPDASVVMAIGGTNVIVRNCSFYNSAGTFIRILGGSYHTIENNRFDTAGSPAGAGSDDHIYVANSHHILIQNNYFTKAGHAAVDFIDDSMSPSHHCVIRNNRIEQHWGGGIYVIRLSHHIVVEDNFISGAGEQVTGYPKTGLQLAADYNIMRRNIVTQTSASPYSDAGFVAESYNFQSRLQTCQHNRVYNNIVYASGAQAVYMNAKHDLPMTDNIYINNIFYANRVSGPSNPYHPSGNDYFVFETYHSPNSQWTDFPHNNILNNNVILHGDANGDYPGEPNIIYYQTATSGRGYTLAQAQSQFPLGFMNNMEINPGFVDAPHDDFRLKPTSLLIDRAIPLTQTTAAGSGTTVPVADPFFFSDGYGIVQGDLIIIGRNPAVRVTAVDEVGKTLTVSAPVSFKVGEGISPAFQGNAPDMGAIEFGSGPPPVINAQAVAPLIPRVFPNPWRKDRHAALPITFDRLTTGCKIKIFTVSGHIVRDLPSASTQTTWDLRNGKGDSVASGIYLFSVKDDSGQTATGKIAVIR